MSVWLALMLALGPPLVAFQAYQQARFMLEGRLFKIGGPAESAKQRILADYKFWVANALFVIFGELTLFSVVLWGIGGISEFVVLALFSLGLIGMLASVAIEISCFLRIYRELEAAAELHPGGRSTNNTYP